MPWISMVDGTWGGGSSAPHEVLVFTLCREFKKSPAELRSQWSPYELRYFWDYLQEVWNQEKSEIESAKKQN